MQIWLETGEGGEVWQASLTDLATRQARYFADYATLLQYLEEIAGPSAAQHLQGGTTDEPKR